MTSAAQFVEGGVQDPCEDACSICLESFCEDDPATVTNCKHEYHLQCILEWSQRSKECPMCWQPLTLKDPDSQDLLAAVEQERALRRKRSQQSVVYQRPQLEEYEFHRFSSYGGDDSDFEERIMQHLAVAAMGNAMGRAHQMARWDVPRFRPSSGQGHQHFLIVPHSPSAQTSSSSVSGNAANTSTQARGTLIIGQSEPPVHSLSVGGQTSSPVARPTVPVTNDRVVENNDPYTPRSRPVAGSGEGQHGASESPSLSETIKSRLAAASSRYRESFTKTTRGFRERLRSRNGAMADLGARAREVSAGVARVLERITLEPTDKQREGGEVAVHPDGGVEPPVGISAQQITPPHESLGHGCAASSTNSIGVTVLAGSVAASSSRVAPQPLHDEGNSSLPGARLKTLDGNSSTAQEDTPVVPSVV